MSGDHIEKLVIGISGATNSGKSTLVEQLVSALPNCSAIHQDDYYLEPGDERLTWIPELNHENWDEMKALEMERLVRDIQQWVRDTHSPGGDSISVLLVDGFLLYNYRPLNELFSKRYFLNVSQTVCRSRRSERNYEPPDVPGYFDQIVWPAYLESREEIKDQSDITFLDGTSKKEDIFQTVLKDILSVIPLTR
ncbi:nicotinamide riboside kinase 2-like [Mizuhopecten yessoensis]|uniref:nicotinamide riboside kinase 2-like n=1 Tax=Mizuhopecten yessoensis TaxID=6573 RepID=UPI000B457E0C|nr:nicotinamide riboside kinase 2-like [Mizuhopecten yessoensis]